MKRGKVEMEMTEVKVEKCVSEINLHLWRTLIKLLLNLLVLDELK